MAGKSFSIEVIDLAQLAQVRGGDKQTAAAQLAIAQAISGLEDVSRSVAPKDTSMTDAMLQMLSKRRSRSGPSSAPALPPTTTLTR